MKNLTWQNPGQLFVAQELIKIVKLKCCGIKDTSGSPAKATFLEIAFGANENPFADATGISSAESQPDLAVTTGHGTITIASKENNTVVISALNGMQAGRVVLKAGETKTVNVPAGLYVVNGVKVIVK